MINFSSAKSLFLVVVLILIKGNILLAQSNETFEGQFRVYDIDSSNKDFHLIFLKKDRINYTIYSEKGIVVDGERLKTNKNYYFKLKRKLDTLNGVVITPVNYLDISKYGYSGERIGLLCIAENLKGLIITKQKEKMPIDD